MRGFPRARPARRWRQLPREHGTRPRLRRVADPEDNRAEDSGAHHRGQERGGLGDGPRPCRRRGVENTRAHDARGPEGEMVWGAAADDRHLYVGRTSGGVGAFRLATGELAWSTPLAPAEPTRRAGHSGAVTATPGMVFSGGWDGVLRALEADSGRVVWHTTRCARSRR